MEHIESILVSVERGELDGGEVSCLNEQSYKYTLYRITLGVSACVKLPSAYIVYIPRTPCYTNVADLIPFRIQVVVNHLGTLLFSCKRSHHGAD